MMFHFLPYGILFFISMLALQGCGDKEKTKESTVGIESLSGCTVSEQSELATIDSVLQRINDLPHPVSLPCLLRSLPRPLSLVATDSNFSAQPALGADDPRIFLMSDSLILSIVTSGSGSNFLEFAEVVDATLLGEDISPFLQTLKGEIEFPQHGISAVLNGDEPYDVMFSESITSCGLCHRNESPHPQRVGGFVSDVFQPEVESIVTLSAMRQLHQDCNFSLTPMRCLILYSLFEYGEVVAGEFPIGSDFFFQ